MNEETFQSNDITGEQTLIALSKVMAFNEWMGEQIFPWLKGDVLEIGSGIGNLSEVFLQKNFRLTLSDLNPKYCAQLKKAYGHLNNCSGVLSINISDPAFEGKYQPYLSAFDSVAALNVIEHIEDDRLAFANCVKLLKPGGRGIFLVPAFNSLFNSFDRELGHHRRYTRSTLKDKMEDSGFKVIHQQYFNMPAMLGWFVSGTLLKNKIIPESQLGFYNRFVPLFRKVDKLIGHSIGLSVIAVGKKTL
jgi:2-polyprenyl-3-methyl-5-hydroxy-6-metoxy-1,4-benzoquinol methylase